MHLFTIGYEGADIVDFVSTLARMEIEHLIDVRDLPASRRRDFSKNILRAHLAEANIEYTHIKALGDPKPGRDAMRQGNVELFEQIFREHMTRPEAVEGLETVVSIATQENSVLMCYERDPKHCHRSIVACEVESSTALRTRHLGVQPATRARLSDSELRRINPAL